MHLVIVESPAKARTIEKYLGKDYTVLATYGHVRDLLAKSGSVEPEHDFAMVWTETPGSQKPVKAIEAAMKKADKLYVATDPDREGEAIAWHICQILQDKKLLKPEQINRIVFHEVTKPAILEAMKNTRALNQELIDAYLARRALDYLVGFTLSPVLWRKLPGSKSAGRVQSVALRLITERDAEIETFVTEEYWSIFVECLTDKKEAFQAKLTHVDNEKLEKFSIPTEERAQELVRRLEKQNLTVYNAEKKEVKRYPRPPFTTSTLQQEAARKLHFSAKNTMRVAQRLYEGVNIGGETVGLITYMRTDSVSMAQSAIEQCRGYIKNKYKPAYLPPKAQVYKTKVKNAQEAHEAIRPTDFTRHPNDLKTYLDKDQFQLYELVWKRAVASQMSHAVKEQIAVELETLAKDFLLKATGSHLLFDGFLTLYEEGTDTTQDDAEVKLPPLEVNEKIKNEGVQAKQHFTQPPPRYTEASLVKKLEELGIGRPSTYASIISVLQAREYVKLVKRLFMAEERGRLVSAFLKEYFLTYVGYDFTAQMEEKLDEVSNGALQWRKVLGEFWEAFDNAVKGTKDLKISDVLDFLDKVLEAHFFPAKPGEEINRKCPKCEGGALHLKIGKYGAFIGCDKYPDCTYIRKVNEAEAEDKPRDAFEPRDLGTGPAGHPFLLKKGPYGFYIEEVNAAVKGKPKRMALPRELTPDEVTLEQASFLMALPKSIGVYPGADKDMLIGIGRYGPYIKYDGQYYSIKKDGIFDITLDKAKEIIDQKKK